MDTPSDSAGLGNAICGFGGVLMNLCITYSIKSDQSCEFKYKTVINCKSSYKVSTHITNFVFRLPNSTVGFQDIGLE